MKSLYVVLILATYLAATIIGSPLFIVEPSKRCPKGNECDPDQCCVENWCHDKGYDLGLICGGPYECADCLEDYVCVTEVNPTLPRNATGRCRDSKNEATPQLKGFKKCNGGSDCTDTQCCLNNWCVEMGNEEGDFCGGTYECPSCDNGLICKNATGLPWNSTGLCQIF